MSYKTRFKCYFGCVNDGPLHRFPSFQYNMDKYNMWKAVLDQETQERGDNYILNSLRLCNRHFKECYISKHSSKLTKNAVPTLNLIVKNQMANVDDCHFVQPLSKSQRSQTTVDIVPKNLTVNVDDNNKLLVKPSTSKQSQSPQTTVDIVPKNLMENVDNCSQTNVAKRQKSMKKTSTRIPIPKNLMENVDNCSQTNVAKRQKSMKKTSTRIPISSRHHFQKNISAQSLKKLKEKIQFLQRKCKSLRSEILAAKKLSGSKSFLNVIENLPDPIKIFTNMQLKYKKKPRGRRFSTEEKIMALTIFKQGPRVYKLLQKMFILPSKRCLQKLLGALTIQPGINEHILSNLEGTVKKMPNEKKIVNLLFDEVALTPGLQYNATRDEITGFEDTGLHKNKILADHALVLMIKGIKGKTKQPISFTFCQSATKKHVLKEIITRAIRELRKVGLKVICTICDQSSTNTSVIKSLQEDTRSNYLREGKEYHSKAFEIDGLKVYPLFDTPHLLKGVRNNFLNKNVKFIQNGKTKYAKWEHLQLLLEVDKGDDEIRLVNKLTENHVIKEKIPKMKVKFAAQVFSQRVSAAMRFLAKRNILPAECEDTADFLLIFDKLFDSFNGHLYQVDCKMYKSGLKNNSPHFKLWVDLLPILESIKFESKERKRGVEVIKYESIPSIKNWIQNINCFLEMWDDLKSNYGVKNLITRNFNQDPLENFFSSIRSNGVRNTNPNCFQFINAYKTLIINNFTSPHSPGANCEKDDNQCMQSLKNLIINENNEKSPLPEPDFACEIDSLLGIMSEIKNSDSVVHAESKNYVTGYVIKKCKSKIFKNCVLCGSDFYRSEADTDSFIYATDYTKKSLFYPTDDLILLMNDIYCVITACLREFPESKYIKFKISSFIDFACDFNMIKCQHHKADLIDYIKKLSMNIIINSWCNGVNRILMGKSLNFDKKDNIKNQAYVYLIKRKKPIKCKT